jgi:hypothetical protein
MEFTRTLFLEAPIPESALEVGFLPKAFSYFGAGLEGELEFRDFGFGDFSIEVLAEQVFQAFRVHGVAFRCW